MPKIPGHALIARIFDRVLPTAPDFFGMLGEQGAQVAHTVGKLVDFMQTASPEADVAIHADEHRADDIKIANIRILNEAFATPIDREDIYRAITNLDEIVNYCKDTVNEIDALGVKPDRFMLEMAEFLLHGQKSLCVLNRRGDLEPVAHNTGIGKQGGHLSRAKGGDLRGLEIGKGAPKMGALVQDG